MRSRESRPDRAALAVVALYGILLSTLLGAMAPIGMPAFGVLCAREERDRPAPIAPAHGPECGILGCAAALDGPPRPLSMAAPPQVAIAVAHGLATTGTAPRSASRFARLPRGPPAV